MLVGERVTVDFAESNIAATGVAVGHGWLLMEGGTDSAKNEIPKRDEMKSRTHSYCRQRRNATSQF